MVGVWIDDVRPAPNEYIMWCKSVDEAKYVIEKLEKIFDDGDIFLDIDHDSGDYHEDGGDYINLLNWLEETGRKYPIKLHSMNPVGIENMRRIIKKNGWKEIR